MKTRLFLEKAMTLLFIVCIMSSMAMAIEVQHEVKGKICDAQGEALPGVTVRIKGSNTGTITDAEGNYSIYVSPDDVLIFSYVGMQTQRVKVKNQKVINVIMQYDSRAVATVVYEYLIYSSSPFVVIPDDKLMERNKILNI